MKRTHKILQLVQKVVSSESRNEKEHVQFSSDPKNLSLIYLKSLFCSVKRLNYVFLGILESSGWNEKGTRVTTRFQEHIIVPADLM